MPRRISLLAVVVMIMATLISGFIARAAPAHAATPWVVTLGDSFISGEAGRWAGNTNDGSSRVDTGADAYFDNATRTAEKIPLCHRSWSAEAFITDAAGYNLACSGAKTSTATAGDFKPGLDFYQNGSKQGQALMLQNFAATHDVKLVVVSIGGNNFKFADIVQQCLQDWLLSLSVAPDYCKDDNSVTSVFTAANIDRQVLAIANGLRRIRQAMQNAGHLDGSYRILVQDYPSPLPHGSEIRYPQSGYSRQSVGGCGFWNADADWANSFLLPTINRAVADAVDLFRSDGNTDHVAMLHLGSAFNGRRLCEEGVGLLEEMGLSSWRNATAPDKTEWVNDIRTLTTIGTDYFVQESMHPNHWGQLALRNCLRKAWNNGSPRGGTCRRSTLGGLNVHGEPNMNFIL
jgi:hypothetical protein